MKTSKKNVIKKKEKKDKIFKEGAEAKGRARLLDKGGAKNGALFLVAILAIVTIFGGMLAGGVVPDILKLRTPPPPANPYTCCDSGDGANCHPITENEVVFNGDTYGLLKSHIYQNEPSHIVPTDTFTPDGHRIFINASDHKASYPGIPGCEPGKDLIQMPQPTYPEPCFGVPNDELIYACVDTPDNCNKQVINDSMPFDVYFRIKDGPVPSEISTLCPKPQSDTTETPQKIVGLPTPSGTANLQLETFRVEQEKKSYHWLNAWCKPADYFYPTEKTNIHFDVKPQGPFTYTDPQYITGGWDLTAFPNGNLLYQKKTYPYIYWDAAIPNNLIIKPQTGYSVAYNDLGNSLSTLLPKLGLNQKETAEFTAYWIKQLPSSKYYFVGIIPQSQINSLAPLSINPAPESLLRVTLYFEPLNEKINASAPQIEPFTRKGFTVVEWGAIFDTQKHPGFSCLM
jgi:hypothetical protein